MRVIDLDATKWKSADDFYDALLPAIGAPELHGRNLNALVDSMIWGGLNAVEPPYTIRISGAATLPKDVRSEIELAKQALTEDRADFRRLRGSDVDVSLEIVS
jgi:RNAse (barnase) inhibitor barstar